MDGKKELAAGFVQPGGRAVIGGLLFATVSTLSSGSSVSDTQKTHDTCMLGANYDERSNCMIGAVKDFISYYHSDTKAKELCASFDGGEGTEGRTIMALCLQTTKDYYKSF